MKQWRSIVVVLVAALAVFHNFNEGIKLVPASSQAAKPRTTSSHNSHHNPQYFTNEAPIIPLIRRMNLANVHMGCRIAAWVYEGNRSKYRRLNECQQAFAEGATKVEDKVIVDLDLIQPHNTIFVPILNLEQFVNSTLDKITVPFVLLSGQTIKVDVFPKAVFQAVVEHAMVQAWFLQNLDVFAAYDPFHAKLHPWPYGIHWLDHIRLLPEMIKAFGEESTSLRQQRGPARDKFIYLSYFTVENNKEAREKVPNGVKVNESVYYSNLHTSHYVTSPAGDRPDCYRHYEAIAMGCVPITDLDPVLYRHLAPGPVIFGPRQDTWNLTQLEEELPRNQKVNRRLIFSEYWIEYVERIVGRTLRWWDCIEHDFGYLVDMMTTVKGMKNHASLLSNMTIPILLSELPT